MTNIDKFYTEVHDLNYRNFCSTLARYRSRILQELKKFGKTENYFVGKVVLDIGTGFQGVIALEMGATSVIHVDINQAQLELMGSQLVRLGLSEKVTQLRVNLDVDSLEGLGKYDVGLIFGIINHLKDPSTAIRKLQSGLNSGGELLFRAYNGKSVTRKLAEKIRCITHGVNYDSVESEYYRKHPEFAKNSFHLRDLLDDLYSPIVKNFIISSMHVIKGHESFSSKDENLRFSLGCGDKLSITERKCSFLMSGVFSRIRPEEKIPLIINLYEIVRSIKYLDDRDGTIAFAHSGYQKYDLFKIIFFYWALLKFIMGIIYERQVRIFR